MTTKMTGWDCHAHLFGPYAKYPLAADRSYTPPEALEDQLQAMLASLGLSHGVLVHPSAYGENYARVLDALAAHPNLRGVLVAQANTSLELGGLRERGVRALRYSHRGGAAANFAGSATIEDLQQMTTRLADAGLHAELWTDCSVLPDIAPVLRATPFPVVIDHMGGFDVAAGVDAPGFRCLLDLLAEGHIWVKLSVYRNLLKEPSLEGGRPFHQAMLEANAEQLVWGSDWPHLRIDPWPDTVSLLDLMKAWTPEQRLLDAILLDNPRRLYE